MKNNCLDIGMIQAFLDRELDQSETARVSNHIALCDTCAMMLGQAEDESAIVFPALEREFNTLVPTQRLWNKINDSIATERDARPFWQKAWAFFAVTMANPSLAAAAGLLVVIGIFATVWMNRTTVSVDTIPADTVARVAVPKPAVATSRIETPPIQDQVTGTTRPTAKFENASYSPDDRRRPQPPMTNPKPNSSSSYMPGEDSYVKTIASMAKTVEGQKDTVMRASQRIAYERDMAVVNDTIAKMRTEVKRNPKNEAAKQVLYSSYQNKIDLLNSVSQKEELVASLR